MTPTLDALRAKYPHLSFTLYAYAGKPVTLECITTDGNVFAFSGPSAETAILAGFADDFAPAPAAPLSTMAVPTASVFD